MQTTYQVFGIPGEAHCVEVVIEVDGQQVGRYSGKSLAVLRAENPGAELFTAADYAAKRAEALRTEPQEITEAVFQDMLEVLPPEGWINRAGCESFKMCEYYSGNITSIYARIGENYYSFRDDADMPHNAIIAKITAHIGAVVG